MRRVRLSRPAPLAVLAVVLIAAFVLAPPLLVGGDFASYPDLVATVRRAFVADWQTGSGELSGLADHWVLYHAVKAVTSAAVLAVLIVLGVRTWRRKPLFFPVAMLGLFALVTVMANVQGMVAPLASLLPMVMEGAPDEPLAATLGQVRQELTGEDRISPAAQAMIGDFGLYHEAMVVMAAVVAVALAVAGVLLWRRSTRVGAVLTALLAVGALTVAAANVSVAADPAPALLAFFNGGW